MLTLKLRHTRLTRQANVDVNFSVSDPNGFLNGDFIQFILTALVLTGHLTNPDCVW